jgi:TP901 family phage tail tape measure protein
MTTDIGELRARLSLEAQQFNQQMEQTRNHMSHMGNSAKSVNDRFMALNMSMQTIGVSSSQISKINEQIRRANPQLLEQMLADVRTELEGLGMDSSEIEKITAEIERAESGTMSFEESLNSIQAAALGLGTAVVGAIGVSVAKAQEFEAQMSRVKAIAGATDEEFRDLEKSALDLGASTSKSASEVAIGFENMAAMGMNANDIIAAMPGVIAAAEASGSDMAQTADVMASALNIFGLKASEATKVADILAKTANISAASLDDMQYALKYAGPPAAALGISLEELSASIGIMTNAGMKGEQAGTTLRSALLGLLDPSEENSKRMEKMGITITDAKGNFVGLSKLVKNLSDSMKGQTETQKAATLSALVGTEAVSGMLSLMKAGPETIDKMTESLENSGGASAEAAAIMKDNLAGAYEELSGALETVGIKLGKEFLPLLTEVTRTGAKVVGSIADVGMSAVNSGLAFAGAAAGIALVISTVGKLAISLKGLYLSMGPGGWIVMGLSLIGGAIAATVVHQREMQEVNLETADSMMKQADELAAAIKQYEELRAKSKLSNEELGRFVDINSEISKTADPNVIARLKDEQEKLRKKSGLSNEELNRMVELNNDLIEKVPEATTQITNQGNAIVTSTDKIKAYNREQYENVRLELEAQKAKAEANQADLLANETEELKRINGLKEKMAGYDTKEIDQRRKLKGLYDDLAVAKANNDSLEIDRINTTIEREEHKLGAIKKQRAETASLLVERTKEMDKIQAQIGKLDEVKRKMIDLELRQGGINAKRGEEIKTIDSAIAKLEKQKRELEKAVPVNQRNTAEYREARDAIQEQINKLQTTKSKVEEIIGKAEVLNATLGSDITKVVTIKTRGNTNSTWMRNKIDPDYGRHTGGTFPRELHVGGLASKFDNLPSHNEVDVRLLRNEMVLTEAQQSNLFRMIDAGFTGRMGSGDTSPTDPKIAMMQQQIYLLSQILVKESNTYLDGKAIYSSNKKHSNHESNLRNIFKGVNKS